MEHLPKMTKCTSVMIRKFQASSNFSLSQQQKKNEPGRYASIIALAHICLLCKIYIFFKSDVQDHRRSCVRQWMFVAITSLVNPEEVPHPRDSKHKDQWSHSVPSQMGGQILQINEQVGVCARKANAKEQVCVACQLTSLILQLPAVHYPFACTCYGQIFCRLNICKGISQSLLRVAKGHKLSI